ncbi:MAG: rod shape-determining protein RodA [Acidimicrobiales bacterium]
MLTTRPAARSHSHHGPPLLAAWRHVDAILVGAVVLISVFGALMVYTTTRSGLHAAGRSPYYDVDKQLLFIGLGLVVMAVVASIDYHRLRDWAPVLYGLSTLLLLGVLVIGHKVQGSQAWFQFGPYQLEPSEVAKVTLIIALASYCATFKGRLNGRGLLIVLALALVPFLLIYKQPDLGTALVLAVVLLAVVLLAGVPVRYLAVLAVVCIVGIVGVVQLGVLKSYQEARLATFLTAPNTPDPALLRTAKGANEYNLDESKIAISDGAVFGKGIGNGPQTNSSSVPEQDTDFIFSAVGEQVGLVGGGILLLLFGLVIWRIWRAATLSRDLLGTLMCVGVLAMIGFQVFENVGMTMGIMPVAGIPLPFVSYGGSALLAEFAGLGLVLSVRMRRFT